MNKATIVVLAVAVGLLAYQATKKSDEPEAARPRTIPGYMSVEQQDEFRKRKENPLLFLAEKAEARDAKLGKAPYDKIAITRRGVKVVFEKKPEAEQTGDAKEEQWKMTSPVESEVESFRVKTMVEAFATDTALTPARQVKNADHLADFGLSAGERIEVELFVGGVRKVALKIGARDKVKDSEGGPDVYDTFVLDPEVGDEQVYRAKQKDLHDAFDHDVAALRSKKVFTFDKSDITKVTVDDPGNEKTPRIVVTATWKEDEGPAQKGPDGKDKPKKKEGTFALVEPTVPDYELGKLDTFFSQIANLRASEFVMGEKPGADTGLTGDAVPKLTVERAGQDPLVILLGGVKEKDKTYYAQVQGRDEYMLVSKYAKENLMKDLGALREKAVLGKLEDTDITRIEIQNEHTGEGSLVFERQGDAWQMTSPAVQTPWDREMKGLVSGVKSLRATEFLDGDPGPDAGLATPKQTVKVTVKGIEKTIVFGEERDSNVQAHILGTQIWFTVSTWSRNKFTKQPRDFRDKALMGIDDAASVTSVELKHSDETVVLSRVPGQARQWQMTAPEALTGANGLDDAKAEAIATSLKTLSIKDFTDKTPDAVGLATPAFTLTATLADGTTRVVTAGSTEEDNAVFVTITSPASQPTAVHTLSKYKLDNLRKKAADLKK